MMKGRHRACDQSLDRLSLGYVGSDENGVSRRLSDERDRLVAFSAVHIGDNNLGAFFRKFKRSGTTNARPRAGHKSDLSSHQAHWLSRLENSKLIQSCRIV